MTELSILRAEIQKVTLEIIDLIGKRNELAREVAKEKTRTGAPLVNREIEQNLRNLVLEKSHDSLIDPKFAMRLLNQLIIESIRTQKSHIKSPIIPNAYTTLLKARRLEQSGRDIIHLEVGEPDFGPPAQVARSLDEAVRAGRTCYTDSAGIEGLRIKIAEHLNLKSGTALSAENVVVSVGGRLALTLSIATNLIPGDEVIIIDPSYPAYSEIVKQSGGRPVHITTRLEENWNPDIGELESSINKSTRMMILNNPCNPIGKSLSKSVFEDIVELAVGNDLTIVSDEVYSNYTFSSRTSILEFPHSKHVYIDSFSKTYGMTGFRLGFAVSDVDTIQRITKLQNLFLTCVPEFIQYAGISAIDSTEDAKRFAELIEKRMKVMCNELENAPLSFYRPDGGFYIFPRLDNDSLTGIEFSDRLLSEMGVAVVPGDAYGSEFSRFFRISICQSEEDLIAGAKMIKEVLR
ncbi:MAG: aminotransferase class I/II-fold pyridoxal phosphate-dependent enzyme [Candidatus Thorarchaeota archaeon]